MNRRHLLIVVAGVAAIVLAHLLDSLAWRSISIDNVYGEDWGRMLRVMGFVPLWLAAGTALILEDRSMAGPGSVWRRIGRSRGGLIIAGATLGGIVAELSKLVVRRLRPGDTGEYAFRPFTERTLSTGGLGMPSSHALVAFGAAAVLARLFPRAWWIWWGLAWGCGLTRVAAGAHFLSDVVAAAVLGWLVGAFLWRTSGRAAGEGARAAERSVRATSPSAAPTLHP